MGEPPPLPPLATTAAVRPPLVAGRSPVAFAGGMPPPDSRNSGEQWRNEGNEEKEKEKGVPLAATAAGRPPLVSGLSPLAGSDGMSPPDGRSSGEQGRNDENEGKEKEMGGLSWLEAVPRHATTLGAGGEAGGLAGAEIPAKTWASLFNPSPPVAEKLVFVPPVIEGAERIGQYKVKDLAHHWDLVLVGCVVGFRPHMPTLEQHLKRLWKVKGDFSIFRRQHGYFLIRFSMMEDMKMPLEGGPWTVRGAPLVVQPWSWTLHMKQEKVSKLPIWVRLPELELKFWSPELISIIASVLGRPITLDEDTKRRRRLGYARVCIEVDVGFEFPSMVKMRDEEGNIEEVNVHYEWRPKSCPKCMSFDHSGEACGRTNGRREWREVRKENPTKPAMIVEKKRPYEVGRAKEVKNGAGEEEKYDEMLVLDLAGAVAGAAAGRTVGGGGETVTLDEEEEEAREGPCEVGGTISSMVVGGKAKEANEEMPPQKEIGGVALAALAATKETPRGGGKKKKADLLFRDHNGDKNGGEIQICGDQGHVCAQKDHGKDGDHGVHGDHEFEMWREDGFSLGSIFEGEKLCDGPSYGPTHGLKLGPIGPVGPIVQVEKLHGDTRRDKHRLCSPPPSVDLDEISPQVGFQGVREAALKKQREKIGEQSTPLHEDLTPSDIEEAAIFGLDHAEYKRLRDKFANMDTDYEDPDEPWSYGSGNQIVKGYFDKGGTSQKKSRKKEKRRKGKH